MVNLSHLITIAWRTETEAFGLFKRPEALQNYAEDLKGGPMELDFMAKRTQDFSPPYYKTYESVLRLHTNEVGL